MKKKIYAIKTMTVGTKEQVIIFIALVIIYLGIYTLRSSGVSNAGASTSLWAGVFAITLGVFSLLTLLFAPSQVDAGGIIVATASNHANIFLLISLVALIASVYFNYKLLSYTTTDQMNWVLYAQIAAHVLLVIAFFYDFNSKNNKIRETGTVVGTRNPFTNVVTPTASTILGTPSGFTTSPRLPVRAR
jgi:hypothetical protein